VAFCKTGEVHDADKVTAGEGLVALTEQEVQDMKLHQSNRAKKDPSKRIYLVGVFHQLHCLVSKFRLSAMSGTLDSNF
jgi:hypothetical protein